MKTGVQIIFFFLSLVSSLQASPLPGDFNRDGEVNFQDFLILSANFGKKVDTSSQDSSITVIDSMTVVDTLQAIYLDTLEISSSTSLKKEIVVDLSDGTQMEFVWIEPGTFLMGATNSDQEESMNETSAHEITITHGFYLGKYEVTQAQWRSVMGADLPTGINLYVPWRNREGGSLKSSVQEGADFPASYIGWDDVVNFIGKLNASKGYTAYRLPTEAEWEYACKAGTNTKWSFGDDESQLQNYAWYFSNTRDIGENYPHEVGKKLPNPWGLYDMHGNVHEFVSDWWRDTLLWQNSIDPTGPRSSNSRLISRTVRGGGYWRPAEDVSSVSRHSGEIYEPYGGRFDYGFRLILLRE